MRNDEIMFELEGRLKLLDKALETLESMDSKIPCERMKGYEWCYVRCIYDDNCMYDHPTKDCWEEYLSGECK